MISESKPSVVGLASPNKSISGQVKVEPTTTSTNFSKISKPIAGSSENTASKPSADTVTCGVKRSADNPSSSATPSKFIKLVKAGRSDAVENVYIDQQKILLALQRLKQSAVNRAVPLTEIIPKPSIPTLQKQQKASSHISSVKQLEISDAESKYSPNNLNTIKLSDSSIEADEEDIDDPAATVDDSIVNADDDSSAEESESIQLWIDTDLNHVPSQNQTQQEKEGEMEDRKDSLMDGKAETENCEIVKTLTLPGWYNKLAHTMTGFLELGCMVDAQLQGCDGGRVPAHQVILAHISPLLARTLPEARIEGSADQDSILILLPQIPTSHIRDFIHAVYTGHLSENTTSMHNVFQVAQLLGIHLPEKRTDFVEMEKEETHQEKSSSQMKSCEEREDMGESQEIQQYQGLENELDEATVADYKILQASQMNLLLLDSRTYEISEVSLAEPLSRVGLQFVKVGPGQDSLNQQESDMNETTNMSLLTSTDHKIVTLGPTKNQESQENPIVFDHSNIQDQMTIKDVAEKVIRKSVIKETPSAHENQIQHSRVIFENISEESSRHADDLDHEDADCGNIENISAESRNIVKPIALESESNVDYKQVRYQPADRPCPLCGKPRIVHKNREIPEIEKGSHRGNYYKCCQCSASKLTAKKLFAHLENHIAKKFKCSMCSKGYSYKNLLEEHEYKIHGEGKNDRYPCPYEKCSYEARYKQTLHTHITDHHKTSQIKSKTSKNAEVTCPRCNKVFRRQHYFTYHKKSCSSVVDGKFECPVCKKVQNSRFSLNKHMRLKHADPGQQTSHTCDICSKPYSSQYSLYNHRLFKHGINSKGEKVPRKLFPCSVCGKVLTTAVKLKTHVEVVHMGKRDFACRYCTKKFTSKSNLSIHEGIQHTGILPYSCDNCDKSFGRKLQLKQHREQVHGLVDNPDSSSSQLYTTSKHYQQQHSLATPTPLVLAEQVVMTEEQLELMEEAQHGHHPPLPHHHHVQISAHHQQLSSQDLEEAEYSPHPQHHHPQHHHHPEDGGDPRMVHITGHGEDGGDPRMVHVTGHEGDRGDPRMVHVNSDVIHEMVDRNVVMASSGAADDDRQDEDNHHDIGTEDTGTHAEDNMTDGHYYVVNDVNSVDGVQVGDVIIPMEFVGVEESVEITD